MKPTPEQVKTRALECRTIRLWLAAFPGATGYSIHLGTGIKNVQSRLFKMSGMGIVKCQLELDDDGQRHQHWYVVPQ